MRYIFRPIYKLAICYLSVTVIYGCKLLSCFRIYEFSGRFSASKKSAANPATGVACGGC